jgi:3-methyladenine DNA glycosylase AlkD
MTLTQATISAIAEETIDALLTRVGHGAPEARAIRRRLSTRVKAESGPDVLAIGLAIASAPAAKAAHVRWVGWELIHKHRPALESLDPAMVDRLGRGMSSWDEVDGFGLYIAGPAWLRGLIGDSHVVAWAKSPDLWLRRAALVATVALNSKSHGGRGDTARTLLIAGLLVDDEADMVIKALSWALRVLIATDRAAVEQFLARHEDRLAARVIREARTKLRTGRKTARKNP